MEKKKLTRTINTKTAAGQEEALEALNQQLVEPEKKSKDSKEVKRLNMDMPLDLYEQIEAEIEENGQTVKGFFVMLAKQYFKGKQA
jgi:uncharacterized coiled-coil protein SlyX